MELSGSITVVEHLPDGRQLVASDAHPRVLVVTGRSNRPPEAARMGYGRPRRSVRVQQPVPERRAHELFLSLLDDRQRAQWTKHQCCWVPTPRGPVRLGRMHDLRFRPAHAPREEWSLCVVPGGPPLPIGDVWTNLLLVLAVDPDAFFRVANVRARGLAPSSPSPRR